VVLFAFVLLRAGRQQQSRAVHRGSVRRPGTQRQCFLRFEFDPLATAIIATVAATPTPTPTPTPTLATLATPTATLATAALAQNGPCVTLCGHVVFGVLAQLPQGLGRRGQRFQRIAQMGVGQDVRRALRRTHALSTRAQQDTGGCFVAVHERRRWQSTVAFGGTGVESTRTQLQDVGGAQKATLATLGTAL
jgi:hypothetical protein